MRLSLWGIGVKQLGRRQSTQHEVELPGQVLRVANTRACALAEERRHEVGGDAHEQNAVVAERFGQQAAEAVDGAPHDVDIVSTPAVRSKQLPYESWILHLLGRLAGQ